MTADQQATGGGPCENTDRELWREREDDYYANSIHVTAHGFIGINVGGYVYVKPLSEWHKLAGGKEAMQPAREVSPSNERLIALLRSWRDTKLSSATYEECFEKDQQLMQYLRELDARESPAETNADPLAAPPCAHCVEAHALIDAEPCDSASGNIADRVGDVIEQLHEAWAQLAAWSESCTGKHGSQMPCVGSSEKTSCAHEWVSARNEAVVSGEICKKCFAIRAESEGESRG